MVGPFPFVLRAGAVAGFGLAMSNDIRYAAAAKVIHGRTQAEPRRSNSYWSVHTQPRRMCPGSGTSVYTRKSRVVVCYWAPPVSAAHSGSRLNLARIQDLLDQQARCWPDGGPAGNPGIVETIRTRWASLAEADRAAARGLQEMKYADSKLLILSENVSKLGERRADMARHMIDAAHQASRQKSTSGEAGLRRVAREREQALRRFSERMSVVQNELLAAQQDMRSKRDQLGVLRKRVSDQEQAIGELFPLAPAASDDETAGSEPDDLDFPQPGVDCETTVRSEHASGAGVVRRHPNMPAEVRRVVRRKQRTGIRERVRRIRSTRRRRRTRRIRRIWIPKLLRM